MNPMFFAILFELSLFFGFFYSFDPCKGAIIVWYCEGFSGGVLIGGGRARELSLWLEACANWFLLFALKEMVLVDLLDLIWN